MGAIYRIWNKENGKSYIGQSRRPYYRIMEHLMPDGYGSLEIGADLLNYDSEVWNWEVLADEKDFSECLDDLEIKYIKLFDALNNGYNIQSGGGVGGLYPVPTDDEHRIRWGGRWINRAEMRETIREAIKDFQFAEEFGISRSTHIWQQKIIGEYGSLEAYEEHKAMEHRKMEREDRLKTLLWWLLIGAGGFIVVLILDAC